MLGVCLPEMSKQENISEDFISDYIRQGEYSKYFPRFLIKQLMINSLPQVAGLVASQTEKRGCSGPKVGGIPGGLRFRLCLLSGC